MLDSSGSKPTASTAQDMRVAELMRAYQRALRLRPTLLDRHAMKRAATLTARAETIATDIHADTDLVLRADNAAAKARDALGKLIRARHEKTPPARPKSGRAGDLAGGGKIPSARDAIQAAIQEFGK